MAFKFLGQRQLGKLPSRWVSTILMVAIGRWAQNAPASSACGARRAVLGRKRLLLTPAAVCASPPAGYITAIAPIPTQKPPIRTAA